MPHLPSCAVISACSVRSVELPTLVLNARNDPFVPGASLPGPSEVSAAVTLEQPRHGGHVGFAGAPFPGSLDNFTSRLLSFFLEFLKT